MSNVDKDGRVLLVVANLSTGGEPRLQKLYQWLDQNAVNMAEVLMRPHYRHIEILTGSDVTGDSFVNLVINLAKDPRTQALDVFLNLHGSPEELHFDDGAVQSSEIKTRLRAKNLKHRLRLLYSTACYGETHADDFVQAGFRVASGATGVNANGPYDYPTQLFNWAQGKIYRAVVRAGNSLIGTRTFDFVAEKILGFNDVNSYKVIVGNQYTRITSEAI